MGYFDSIDVQDALEKKSLHAAALRAAQAEFEAQSDEFATIELPEIMSEFVSKAALLVEPEPISGTETNGWAVSGLRSGMDSYDGATLLYFVGTDCTLFFSDPAGTCPVDCTHIVESLTGRVVRQASDARSIERLAGDMRQNVMNCLTQQLQRFAKPGASARS